MAFMLSAALTGAGLLACSSGPARPDHPAVPSPAPSSVLELSCADSAGQQGQDHEIVTGGVEGLNLPGSDDPAALYPIAATRYSIYKAFLAVSPAAAPFATVSVIRPASARLVYAAPARMGALFNTRSGRPLLAASRSAVRLPACGPRFTGFTGGVLVRGPACVTIRVSSPAARAATVTVPIGPVTC